MSEAVVDPQMVQHYSQVHERLIRSLVMTGGKSFEEAFQEVKEQHEPVAATSQFMATLMRESLEAAWLRIEEEQKRVSFYTRCTLQAGRVAWYNGPTNDAEEWNRLVERLRSLGRDQETIDAVDQESTAILNLIDNPGKERFSTRGLVVGYVQSGKTGNMAAVLAKAAGTPFKFFIVLSGMTDSLRNQTQKRLDADILNLARPGRWQRQTRADLIRNDGVVEKGDFTLPPGGSLQLLGETRHLAVMKKNAGVLRRFLRALRNTPKALREQTPFLMIDDECDQASVNSAAVDNAVTVINDLIRQILAELPRVAYVGYTATPYANVLINTSSEDDLYPRDFIHPLSKAVGYFGAEELFGRAALEGDASKLEEEGYSMIRVVDPKEVSSLRPVGKSTPFVFEVSASLRTAIHYFVLCLAAKEIRGLGGDHASMLVHTSMLTGVHEMARGAISAYLNSLIARLVGGDAQLQGQLRELWETESEAVPASRFGRSEVSFDELEPRILACAKSIEIKVENWESTDRIDYDVPGRRYLVIGGNVLARGLTLEGLVVSFFMRTSSQYDTLMQMGRWFGYRRGFEDMPRIWMEAGIQNAFYQLATVEEEIRRDIGYYSRHNVTPAQFAVRIRKIPGMMITNRNRLRHTVKAQVGYAGRHLQTIRFLRWNENWLSNNWRAGDRLLKRSRKVKDRRATYQADLDAVLAFLGEYSVHSDNSGLDGALLAQYLRQATDGSLDRWNVVVVTTADGSESGVPLGGVPVRCVNRSAMRGGSDDVSIKALMSKRDLLLDLDPVPSIDNDASWEDVKKLRGSSGPLLLLYPIDRNSQPHAPASSDREKLDAVHDVLGIGVFLPGDPIRSYDYVTTNLTPIEPDEEPMDEIARELLEG
ncbi:Z1 domain-containing protein [Pseudoxanthomonas suwonensis]|uniref:Z1 domain-containing protein n=1 Tax=Pseudoxanthomonas suwonensis TaxID=314722 RepID=UPI0004B72AE3|nr:Z1 domain-containing protein [Pseudoxanthomonas suwonensis]